MDRHGPALRLPRTVRLGGAALAAGFLGLFFAWPVASILARGLQLDAVRDAISNPGIRSVAWFTAWQAAVSTALTLAVGLPVAYVLSRYTFPGRRIATALVTVPFVLPTVVVGTAFLAVLPRSWHQSIGAILAAHVFFNVAVVVRTVGGFWGRLDRGLDEAARTLGATAWQTTRHVTLPLLRPALVAAGSIVFLFSFTSYGVVTVVGGPRHPTLEVELYRRAVLLGELPVAAALALLQLAVVVALLLWWSRLQRRSAVSLRARPAARPPRSLRERTVVVAVLGGAIIGLGAPLVALIVRSWRGRSGWTAAGWQTIGADGWDALATSLRFALAATVIATAIGSAAAFAVTGGGRLGTLLDSGLMLPLGTSAVTLGFGLLITFDDPPLDLRGSVVIIPLAHALVGVPFVVRSVVPALRAIDPHLGEAAATLGAGPWQRFRWIDVALARRAIIAGAGFCFAVSLGEFGATSFLTRRGNTTLPIEIARAVGRPGELALARAAALSTVLLAITAAAVLAVDRFQPEERAW